MNEYIKSPPPECHPVMQFADLPRHPISFLRLFLNRLMEGIVFKPSYAALIGYDEIIKEKARLTDEFINLPEHIRDELDRKFMLLSAIIDEGYRPEVTVTYFIPDSLKAGGSYDIFTGEVKRVDSTFRTLIFYDREHDTSGKVIDIDCIVSAESKLFDEMI